MYTLTDNTALAKAMVSALGSAIRTKVITCVAADNGREHIAIEVSFAGITACFDAEPVDGADSAYSVATWWDTMVTLDGSLDEVSWSAGCRFFDEETALALRGDSPRKTVPEAIALGKELICLWLVQSGRQALSEGFSSWESDSEEEESGEP